MRKILFVIDMQNDFIDGSLGTKEAVEIVPRVVEKIAYLDSSDGVVYTMDTHFDNYMETLEGKKLPVYHCVKGTDGNRIKDELQEFYNYDPSIQVIEKNTFGCSEAKIRDAIGNISWSTYGDREQFTDGNFEIEIVGLCTDICVLSNAIILRAMYPNTKITVDSSCCAGTSVEAHRNALEAMKMCQIDVI